jgi:hypothetical protein
MLSSFSKGKFIKNLFSAGGGGEPIPTPLGDATYWGVFATFADLDSIPSGDIREGDLASVTNVDGSGSEALVVRSEGWKIRSVVCDSFTTLGGISVPIMQGANGFVASEDDTGTRYVYAGASWFRAPVGFNFQFPPVTSTDDLAGLLDPLDGDSVFVFDAPLVGRYIYNDQSASWELSISIFTTVAAMNAYDDTNILIGAIAFVDSDGEGSINSVVYIYDDGQWNRTPDGIGYVWNQVNNWAGLSAIDGPKNTDRANVNNLGFTHSTGIAEYGSGQWELSRGTFASVSNMTSFANSIQNLATARVKSGGDHDEQSVFYVRKGSSWERSASLTSGYTWTSTNIADINNTDPSGIGVTKPGDYLRLVLASGNRLFRLKRFTTAGGDVKNVDVWVPADWLESGTVKLWSYLVGNEANRIGSGFTDTIAGGGGPSITGDISGSGYTRLQSGSGGSSAQLVSTSLSLGVNQQIYMRAQMRGTASGANAACGPYSADGTNVSYAQMYSSSVFQFHTIAGGNLNSTTLRSNGSVLPNTSATGDFIEMLDEGRTVLSSIYRSGALYHTAKRNQATLGSSVTAFAAASGGVLDVRYAVVITRTP